MLELIVDMEEEERDQTAPLDLTVKGYKRHSSEGTALVDADSNSGTCVRFQIARTISNLLFVNKQIDVHQSQIMNSLVHLKEGMFSMHPREYNDKILIVQDVKNSFPGNLQNVPNKSWWQV